MSGAEEPTSEELYDLVMPFVTVRSKGGPHDDDAYVAGWEMASLDCLLSQRPSSVAMTIRSDNRPQADLIAMKHGFSVDIFDDDGEWSQVEIRRDTTGP